MFGKGLSLFFCVLISSSTSSICFLKKKCSLPIQCSWHSCWKSIGQICKGLFLDFLFCSTCLQCILLLTLQCFDFCGFAVSSEVKKSESSNFDLFQNCFGYWNPLKIQISFRMSFYISWKNAVEMLIVIHWISLYSFWVVLT